MALLLNANALHIPIADNSVQMCVTSPPYWALRSYLDADSPNKQYELGSERVPDCLGWATGSPCVSCYVFHMVSVFREVKRILRDDGVLFLNLGDSYAANRGYQIDGTKQTAGSQPTHGSKVPSGLKPKDLCMIPSRVALALQADGWWLRSGITWVKLNPLPESVTDRPTKSTEMVYVLTKSESYTWDTEAVKETSVSSGRIPGGNHKVDSSRNDATRDMTVPVSSTRNMRDVIILATQPTKEAHFATMPEALVDRCIRAGTSEGGCCPTCGKAWERVTQDGDKVQQHWAPGTQEKIDIAQGNHGKTSVMNTGFTTTKETLGFRQSCTCPPQPPVGCLVFDPFTGSGTSGRVATKLNRRFIGTELSLKYLVEIAKKRTSEIQPKMIGF
jgi:DNA modification methylase